MDKWGLEPQACRMQADRSSQLELPTRMRLQGIEPWLLVLETNVLPQHFNLS